MSRHVGKWYCNLWHVFESLIEASVKCACSTSCCEKTAVISRSRFSAKRQKDFSHNLPKPTKMFAITRDRWYSKNIFWCTTTTVGKRKYRFIFKEKEMPEINSRSAGHFDAGQLYFCAIVFFRITQRVILTKENFGCSECLGPEKRPLEKIFNGLNLNSLSWHCLLKVASLCLTFTAVKIIQMNHRLQTDSNGAL